MKRVMMFGAMFFFMCVQSPAADWPMFGSDAGRTGYSAETLPVPLSLRWTYTARHKPMPAWPLSNRLPYDRAYHTVIANGTLYFGSSADCKVYALDAATGKERWTFFTGGPVRFAPALWKDRAFVVSDDGFLYCLAAGDGKLLWQRRGGPDGRLLLGNDRMISRWPARGGPAVVDDIVYFAAGIWPSDGIYLHALDADSGKVLWVNDNSGSIYMAQPHGGAYADSGVSAQGYLVVSGNQLFVPTGRAVPAAFKRGDGAFEYFRLQLNGHKGGSSTLAKDSYFVNAGITYDAKTGLALDPLGKPPAVAAVSPNGLLGATANQLLAFRWIDKERVDRKGVKSKYRGLEKLWSVPNVAAGTALIVAGNKAISSGGKRVSIVDLDTKELVWSVEVDGTAEGLAAAAGRLYVSTDQGTIHCFDARNGTTMAIQEGGRARTSGGVSPYGANTLAATAAEEIVKKGKVTDGYAVDLGCGDGALAFELARRTQLQIHAIDTDPAKVAQARAKLDAAGLYGVRVTVHQGTPPDLTKGGPGGVTPFAKYFADLVVSSHALITGSDGVSTTEVERLQRPYGGVACLGKAGALRASVRGPLAGAGSWTHQYADPANTGCSADALVKGPLGMLWYRDSDFDMPSRHGRGPAPLYLDGRLFVEGTHGLRTVDAYNGRVLWEYPLQDILKPYHGEHLMGASGTGSNFCVAAEGLFLRTGNKCLRLEAATGKKLAEFETPARSDGKPGTWGFIACDEGTLFGSLANEEHVVRHPYGKADMSKLLTESNLFFALDAVTGKLKWTYRPRHSLRHNAIAIGGGKVYLMDRSLAESDRLGADKGKEHPKGELLALDAASGKVLWKSSEDIYGTLLALSVPHQVLLMSYQPTAFRLPSERGGQMTAFAAADGKRLWEINSTYSTRPIINDRTIYAGAGAQGGAWDLRTGEARSFLMKRSYGCGQFAASTNLMVFRSATLGYFDLTRSKQVESYGGIRPGCWINALPAGGIVLVPDASSGCQCSYLNQAWIALQTME